MTLTSLQRPTRAQWVAIVLGVLPWTWFLVRDLSGRMDILALAWPVFGTIMAWGLLVLAFVFGSRRLLFAGLSWTACLLVVVVGAWRPLDTGSVRDGTAVRIAAVNVFGSHTHPPSIVRQLDAYDADVVVVSEVAPAAEAVYRDAFRHAVPSHERADDVAVYADLPMRDLGLPASLRDQRGRRVEVEGPDGPFVLYALHLQKPGTEVRSYEVGFRTHRRLIDRIVAAVRAERLPVVVAGDLNLADRTSGFRDLTGVLDDAMRADWVGPTSRKLATRLLLARIDHILMSPDWCSADSKTFTMRGSDHRGVVATVGRCG